MPKRVSKAAWSAGLIGTTWPGAPVVTVPVGRRLGQDGHAHGAHSPQHGRPHLPGPGDEVPAWNVVS